MENGSDDASGAWARLDRHALVMSIWLALGFVAAALLARGFHTAEPLPVYGAFTVVIAGFVGHVIINAVSRTLFSAREVALGLVVYAVALVGFLLALLLRSEPVLALFVPLSIGLLVLAVVVIFYMVTHFGARGAFRAFDVISDFGPDEVRRRDAQG
jgi:hypothetical protein